MIRTDMFTTSKSTTRKQTMIFFTMHVLEKRIKCKQKEDKMHNRYDTYIYFFEGVMAHTCHLYFTISNVLHYFFLSVTRIANNILHESHNR